MADSIGYQWFILLFTLAILVVCIINAINYGEIKRNFEAYNVTLAFTADPLGYPVTPISPSPLNIGAGKPYVNGDLVSVTNASLTGFQRGSFNVTMATYDINTGEATFTNAVNVNGTTFGPSTYNIAPTVNPDGMSEGSILAGLWINIILAILSGLFFIWRVILFFKTPEDIKAATFDKFGEQFEPFKFKDREEKAQILSDNIKATLENAGYDVSQASKVANNVKELYIDNLSKPQAVFEGAEPFIGTKNAISLANNFKYFNFLRPTDLEGKPSFPPDQYAPNIQVLPPRPQGLTNYRRQPPGTIPTEDVSPIQNFNPNDPLGLNPNAPTFGLNPNALPFTPSARPSSVN
jgi:hypothetical protein